MQHNENKKNTEDDKATQHNTAELHNGNTGIIVFQCSPPPQQNVHSNAIFSRKEQNVPRDILFFRGTFFSSPNVPRDILFFRVIEILHPAVTDCFFTPPGAVAAVATVATANAWKRLARWRPTRRVAVRRHGARASQMDQARNVHAAWRADRT